MSKKLYAFSSVLVALCIALTLSLNFEVATDSDVTVFEGDDLTPVNISTEADNLAILAGQKQPFSERKKRVKGVANPDNPDLFAAWHNGIRTRHGADRPDYPHNYKIRELLKANDVESTKELSSLQGLGGLDWVSRGPANVGGRTRGLLIYPGDPTYSTWFAGSVGGGVWKTEDAGATWTNLTADLPDLSTSTLAMGLSNPNVIYVGTGEGFGNVDNLDGSGIWRSDDGGTTFTQLASTASSADFENITRIVVDPNDPDTFVFGVAAGFNDGNATSGIYRSTDGGATVTKVYESGAFSVEHIVANPENFNTLYAAVNGNAVFKSIDAGQNWFSSSEGIGPVGRSELAIAPTDTATIYAAAQGGALGSILYKSEDAGATWFGANDENAVHWLGGQGWYDNTIAVHPFNKDVVFVGGVRMWQLDGIAGQDTLITVLGVDQENLSTFFSFVNFGGRFGNGGLETGAGFHGLATGLTPDEFTSVEVRLGPGKSQKAHRFLFAGGFQYPYQDYVDVPFEVWDIDNNQQLMVSFRDDENNGVYELEDRASDIDGSGIDREYLFIHSVAYDSTAPDPMIAVTAGQVYKNTFAMWPVAPAGAGIVSPDTLSFDATIRIKWGTLITNRLASTQIASGPVNTVHVDHHNLLAVPTDTELQTFMILNGNDGGVSVSMDNGVTWSETDNGYITSQFYGADKMNGADRYFGGMQDNGTWFSPAGEDASAATNYTFAIGGDGYETSWHYNDPLKMIGGSQFNGIRRSLDGGASFSNANTATGLLDVGSNPQLAPFFTKIASTDQDPDLLFAVGASGVWRTDNFAGNWTLAPMTNAAWNGISSFSQVKISLHNPQIVWTGRDMVTGSTPYVSTDGGITFSATNLFTDVTMGRLSGFATHPTEDSTAYALFSIANGPKILGTTDLGQSWEDITGFGTGTTSASGFPDVAVYSCLVMPFNTDVIWAGTEIGIFESNDGGASWALQTEGFPATGAYEMFIVNDQVVVATHGRGIWSVTMPELSGYEPPVATLAPRFASVLGGGGGQISATLQLPSPYDSSFVYVDGQRLASFAANTGAVDSVLTLIVATTTLDTVDVSVSAYAGGVKLSNVPIPTVVFPLNDPQAAFAEDFNADRNNFVLSGLDLLTGEAGFADGALHSPHPYTPNRNFIALLKTPIEVASSGATFAYDDVAIVEPGNAGTVFGDATFWDFVIVEGSNDNGISWTPLADGYDARFNATWLANDPAGPGDSTMFVHHELDLLDTFSAGEVILVRFRLEADPGAESWGWVIDNLNIQDGVVSVEDDGGSQLPQVFSLSQNYPNPFNPTTQIDYALPKQSEVTLTVFNVLGQSVRTLLQNEKREAGRYTVQWDGKDQFGRQVSSGLYFYRIQAAGFVKSFKMTLLK